MCVGSTHIWVLSQQALGDVFATRLLNANHAEIVEPSSGRVGAGVADRRGVRINWGTKPLKGRADALTSLVGDIKRVSKKEREEREGEHERERERAK